MKKKYKIITALVVFISVFSIGLSYFLGEGNHGGSGALGKTLTSIDELDSSAKIILKGNVKPKSGDVKLSFEYEQYPVEITEVLKNTTGNKLNIEDTILLSVPTKMLEIKGVESGEYILFLNTLERNEQLYYLNNSINNLYKLKNKKYINVFGEKYKFGKDGDKSLQEIEESDVIKLKEKNNK